MTFFLNGPFFVLALAACLFVAGCSEPAEPQRTIDPPLAAEPPQPDSLPAEPTPPATPSTEPDTIFIEPLAPPPTETPTLPPPVTETPAETTAPPETLPPKPTSTYQASSGLLIPVSGIGPEDLIDTYTQARSGGRVHNAIDIIAPQGTPVLAAAEGTIRRFFTSDKGGLTIYQIAPDNRTVYYYAHLDSYAEGLKKSDIVQPGDIIGYVGDTGNAVPGNYHLHFAIWLTDDPTNYWDGESVNPYPLLKE